MQVKTPDQVKQQFRQNGWTFTQWATENGYSPTDVYRVLNGLTKAKYGKGHDIAVKLGLKTPNTTV
ncbi:DNA-binding protein [Serratia bockelmannii]|uniref:DNA-binding protein n=1 Tax=Serratia bockelmannii TaxID=2703793 RepID=UPI003E32EE77